MSKYEVISDLVHTFLLCDMMSDQDELCIILLAIYNACLIRELLLIRTYNRHVYNRSEHSFPDVTASCTRKTFRKLFRMQPKSFQKLLKKLRPLLDRNVEMGRRWKRVTIPPDVRLGITLRLLSGASYLDVMLTYRLAQSTVYVVFHDTCDAIMDTLRLPGLPKSVRELENMAHDFKTSRAHPNPLSGCVGAVDGISVRIRKPHHTERPAAYFCRKGYYSLPVQAMVDSKYRFLSFSARCVGSTHDALAHAVSDLGQFLEKGLLHCAFWVAGDEAYTCTNSLITPYPMSQAEIDEFNFNFFLSSYRVHVEQAFGQLVARWRILQTELQFPLKKNARIVCVCLKLHNFCVDEAEGHVVYYFSPEEKRRIELEVDVWYVGAHKTFRENVPSTFGRAGHTMCDTKRKALCNVVKESGLVRPVLLGAPPR